MRRQLLRATPAMIRRAALMFAPLDKPAVLPIAKKQSDQLLDHVAQPAERQNDSPSTK